MNIVNKRVVSRSIDWRFIFQTTSILALLFILAVNVRSAIQSGASDDWISFMQSGHNALIGADPYMRLADFIHFGQSTSIINLNPPAALLLFAPLSLFDVNVSQLLWMAFSLCLYGAVLFALLRSTGKSISLLTILWLTAFSPFWHDLGHVQIYTLILALLALAWLRLRKSDSVTAGFAIGVACAIKPNLAIWPALLLLAGWWKVSLGAGLGFAGINLSSVFAFGNSPFLNWYRMQSAMMLERVWYPTNVSLYGPLSRLFSMQIATIAAGILLAGLALWVWKKRPSFLALSTAALAASVLASPIAWVGYCLWILPAFLEKRDWSFLLILGAGLLCIPYPVIWRLAYGNETSGWVTSFLIIIPVVLVLLDAFNLGRLRHRALL